MSPESKTIILIAEDDDAHYLLIQKNLRRQGLDNDFVRFRDGREIMEFMFGEEPGGFNAEKTYILILDIRMPLIDGREVLRKIKAREKTRDIPVIMLSTTDDPDDIEYCRNAGCSIYIVKPVEYESFVKAVEKIGTLISISESQQGQ